MKQIITVTCVLLLLANCLFAQDNVYPAAPFSGQLLITNAVVHVGNGRVIENGSIQINNGKIEQVMEGKLEPFVEALTTHFQTEKLKEQAEQAA